MKRLNRWTRRCLVSTTSFVKLMRSFVGWETKIASNDYNVIDAAMMVR